MQRRWLASVLALTLLATGCSQAERQESDGTRKALLKNAVSVQAMPLATKPAAESNPVQVFALSDALNLAWQPLIASLAPDKASLWGKVSIQFISTNDALEGDCKYQGFDIALAHGVYCKAAPASSKAPGAASEASGHILLPNEHFWYELRNAPGDKFPNVAAMVSYFYALHVRRHLVDAGLVAIPWGEQSATQWCLTGVSLRALWPQPVILSSSPPSAAVLTVDDLPLDLAHIFGGLDVDDRHWMWALEGYHAPSVNSCFTG